MAAGRGERLGATKPKCLVEVCGIPLAAFSIWEFNRLEAVTEIALVVPGGLVDEGGKLAEAYGFEKIVAVRPGGQERQHSVRAGVEALSQRSEKILIHDGARPFVSGGLITRIIAALGVGQAVFPGLPVGDTLHRAAGDLAVDSFDRSGLVAAQTPQGFLRKPLIEALGMAAQMALARTDEVTLLRETLGIHAVIVPGESSNLKFTYATDLTFFEPQFRARAELIKGSR